MIDPDSLIIENINRGNIITVKDVEPFSGEVYCLDDEKDFKKYITDIEKDIRRSIEYRIYISYLRDNMQMNKCAYLSGITNEETYGIKIEIHHYPFSLYDVVTIVVRKRMYYGENMSVRMVAKEAMKLHYQLLIGLIPLSETVHELAHSGKLFIPSDKVMGRYNVFIDYYKPFCDPDQLETIDRIEKYSEEQRSSILDTTILNQNRINYEIKSQEFMLPDTNLINNAMLVQIKSIKDNNYILPSINDKLMIEQKPEVRCPLVFYN